MPIHAPEHDPADFAMRLREAMHDAGENTGRGAGVALAARHRTSPVTASAWLKGTHLPTPERVRVMADDYGVSFDWLYFGKLPKRPRRVSESVAEYLVQPYLDALSPRERGLIDNFRAATEASKLVIEAAAAAAVPPPAASTRKPSR